MTIKTGFTVNHLPYPLNKIYSSFSYIVFIFFSIISLLILIIIHYFNIENIISTNFSVALLVFSLIGFILIVTRCFINLYFSRTTKKNLDSLNLKFKKLAYFSYYFDKILSAFFIVTSPIVLNNRIETIYAGAIHNFSITQLLWLVNFFFLIPFFIFFIIIVSDFLNSNNYFLKAKKNILASKIFIKLSLKIKYLFPVFIFIRLFMVLFNLTTVTLNFDYKIFNNNIIETQFVEDDDFIWKEKDYTPFNCFTNNEFRFLDDQWLLETPEEMIALLKIIPGYSYTKFHYNYRHIEGLVERNNRLVLRNDAFVNIESLPLPRLTFNRDFNLFEKPKFLNLELFPDDTSHAKPYIYFRGKIVPVQDAVKYTNYRREMEIDKFQRRFNAVLHSNDAHLINRLNSLMKLLYSKRYLDPWGYDINEVNLLDPYVRLSYLGECFKSLNTHQRNLVISSINEHFDFSRNKLKKGSKLLEGVSVPRKGLCRAIPRIEARLSRIGPSSPLNRQIWENNNLERNN